MSKESAAAVLGLNCILPQTNLTATNDGSTSLDIMRKATLRFHPAKLTVGPKEIEPVVETRTCTGVSDDN